VTLLHAVGLHTVQKVLSLSFSRILSAEALVRCCTERYTSRTLSPLQFVWSTCWVRSDDRIPNCHSDSLESGNRRRYRAVITLRVVRHVSVNAAQHSGTACTRPAQHHNMYCTVRALQEQSLPCATLTNWSLQCKLSSVRYEMNFYILFSLHKSLCRCRPFLHPNSLFFTYFLLFFSSPPPLPFCRRF